MMHRFACKENETQFCLACAAIVCACQGTARGQCPVCHRGLLSQYAKPRGCGYKGCKAHAVAESPRVRYACLEHAVKRGGYTPLDAWRMPEQAQGSLAYYSTVVRDRIAAGTQATGM